MRWKQGKSKYFSRLEQHTLRRGPAPASTGHWQCAAERMRTRTRTRPPGVTAVLPGPRHSDHPQTGHGALHSLSWSQFQRL